MRERLAAALFAILYLLAFALAGTMEYGDLTEPYVYSPPSYEMGAD